MRIETLDKLSDIGCNKARKLGNELPNTKSEVLIKVRDVIKRLEREGWKLVGVKGDHRQFEHPSKPGKVTVPGRLGSEMPKGTLGNIRRQGGGW